MPTRRIVLRGAIALAMGAVAPFSLSGCDAKKGEPSTGSAPTDSIVTPAANKKMLQADVGYQNQPKGDQRCADCQNFLPETNTCMLVTGQVSPQGWCSLWTKKA